MRAIQRPRVRVKSTCGIRRSKMRISRMSSQTVIADLGPGGSGTGGKCCDEAQAEDHAEGGDGELAEDGRGECHRFAAEAKAGLNDLFPCVDVVLVFAGEELAHLGVDAVDVGYEREDGEEDDERDGLNGRHARTRFMRVGCSARSMRPLGRLNSRRSSASTGSHLAFVGLVVFA